MSTLSVSNEALSRRPSVLAPGWTEGTPRPSGSPWMPHVLGRILSSLEIAKAILTSPDWLKDSCLSTARRTAHDIKGLCGLAGLHHLYHAAEQIERNLDQMATSSQVRTLPLRNETLDQLTRFQKAAADVGEPAQACGTAPAQAVGPELIRMSSLWRRSRRLAEQISKRLNKNVRVVCRGGSVELAPQVFTLLAAAVGHLVRNALYHGIESPALRYTWGKAPIGKLWLIASVDGSDLVVAVKDDGVGINWNALHRAGLESPPGETRLESASPELRFRPGASTSPVVCDLGGRGLGLYAVQSAMQQLGGTMTVRSTAGRGTRFTLRIPLA